MLAQNIHYLLGIKLLAQAGEALDITENDGGVKPIGFKENLASIQTIHRYQFNNPRREESFQVTSNHEFFLNALAQENVLNACSQLVGK
ncbi:MAG: hypothetical protein P8X65_13565 [Syntrophobacterales bacterium]